MSDNVSNKKIFNRDYFECTYGKCILKGSHPFQHSYWIRYLHKQIPKGRLLDVGCGLGFFIERAIKYYECYGIDTSDHAISIAKKRIKNAILAIGDANALGFKGDFFDIIISFDVLEHLEYPQVALSESYRALKIGGILILSVPNTESIGLQWKGKEWFGYRDPTHISLLSPSEWINLLECNKFEIIDIRYEGLWDLPYFKKIPQILQYLAFTIPSLILFWLGFRIPQRYGENIFLVARKIHG